MDAEVDHKYRPLFRSGSLQHGEPVSRSENAPVRNFRKDNKMLIKLVTPCALAVFSTLAAIPAAAQDEWVGQITPYIWAVGVSGNLTPFSGAPDLSFNRSFSEGRDDLEGAFFLTGFARRDRLVVLADVSYSSSSRGGRIPPGIPVEGELQQRSMTLAAGWRVHKEKSWSLDVLGGARLWNIKANIDVAGARLARVEKSFTDPVLALRANIQLGLRWSAIAYFDVGGFGVGSDQTIQALVTANYQVNDNLFLSAGYRRLDVDYEDGGTKIDWTMEGPLLGLTWRF
ncbi:hypothetical protein [Sedimentitalea sp.]|uniref:hypothetical protein n=1 Tax=Sedimentitalea sp. TaxID=2048915 RepID=UPI003299C8DB